MHNQTCPICLEDAEWMGPTTDGGAVFNCELCGKFALSGSLFATITNDLSHSPDQRAVVSYAIRAMQRDGKPAILSSYTFNDIIKSTRLPSFAEQAERLLLNLGDVIARPGRKTVFETAHRTIIGAESPRGLGIVIDHLKDEGLIKPEGTGGLDEGYLGAVVALSPTGWMKYEELRKGRAEGRAAFMAMKFNDPVLDRVLSDCFRPAAEATGFRLAKLDEGQPAGLIDHQIEVRLRIARFVVVDLTHGNAGAYWEAGFATGLGKPVIYTCEKSVFQNPDLSRRPHFDTSHHVTVVWEEANLPVAAAALKAVIRATLPGEAILSDP